MALPAAYRSAQLLGGAERSTTLPSALPILLAMVQLLGNGSIPLRIGRVTAKQPQNVTAFKPIKGQSLKDLLQAEAVPAKRSRPRRMSS